MNNINQAFSETPKALSFLGSVANAYVNRYDDLSDFCFVFPNKRAGTFFLKALSENLGERTMLAPEVMAIPDFMSTVADREVAPRIDMLFRLYRVYKALLDTKPDLHSDRGLLDFDRFAPWGETVLGDFSEVDRYDVDAHAIFKNVRDYRNISANFLTEEQLDVIERYFGYRPAADNIESFWNTIDPEEDLSKLKEKFVELWRLLPELYDGLRADLEQDNLAMPGTTFRLAMERVKDGDLSTLPWRRVVFVGFNMLSTTEARLMGELRDMQADDGDAFAEFFWDATGPVLSPDSAVRGAAVSAIRRNIRNFPAPAWAHAYLQLSRVDEMPASIVEAAAPSNSAQVKIAALRMSQWSREIGREKLKDARAAVVIPDENLLLPLIHSLPHDIGTVNLTMGYALRYTSVASFVRHLRRLQTRQRKGADGQGFYHEDFKMFMSHPLVHAVIGSDTANAINTEIARTHIRVVTPGWLTALPVPGASEIATLLHPLKRDTSVADTINYISGVLDRVDEALAGDENKLYTVNSKIERTQISLYQQALSRLLVSVTAHGIDMRFSSVFHLVDRLLAGETVTFEGEPLEGLQIMGLLETRALDFDHLIILSMNDKIMPRRSRGRTFIPDTLRRGYGMSASSQGEELYAYYFYRLLSRAKDVTLIYDARAGEGMRSGGKSRFLMQLDMLYARGAVEHRNYSFGLSAESGSVSGVTKTPRVMELLDEFCAEKDGRSLSASALMNYCRCQVLFYYKNVVGLRDEQFSPDFIDPITMGQVLHRVMLELYLPDEADRKHYLKKRVLLTEDMLKRLHDDEQRIADVVRRAINIEHFHLDEVRYDRPLTGSTEIVAKRLVRMVLNILAADKALAPIELVGGEIAGGTRWRTSSGREINMRFAFDRVDVVGGRMRIVDYKSGRADAKGKMEEVFTGRKEAHYVLQLLFYARLLRDHVPALDRAIASDPAVLIYDFNALPDGVTVVPKLDGQNVVSYAQVADEFERRLDDLLEEIFNSDITFQPTEDESNCSNCRFSYLCGRE